MVLQSPSAQLPVIGSYAMAQQPQSLGRDGRLHGLLRREKGDSR